VSGEPELPGIPLWQRGTGGDLVVSVGAQHALPATTDRECLGLPFRITASAELTKGGSRDSSLPKVCGCLGRIQCAPAGLRHRGAVRLRRTGVRGVPEIPFSFPQERGNKGVERDSAGGQSPPVWIPAPRLREDKLRGNDPPEADLRRTGVWGHPPTLKILPPRMGARGLKRKPNVQTSQQQSQLP